jgi:hypothetical protein
MDPSDSPAGPAGTQAAPPASVEALQAALAGWEAAFAEERQAGGAFAGIEGRLHPLAVLNELQRALAAERAARAEAAALRRRAAAAGAAAAAHALDDVVLRQELHAARAAGEPSVLQLRQLLLDPATNREFARLRAEAAAAQEELRALHVSRSGPAALGRARPPCDATAAPPGRSARAGSAHARHGAPAPLPCAPALCRRWHLPA